MNTSSLLTAPVPFQIGGTFTNFEYREIRLSKKATSVFEPIKLELHLIRINHRPAVLTLMFGPSTQKTFDRKEFTSWQNAHEDIERLLDDAVNYGGWSLDSDLKCPHYHVQPLARVRSFLDQVMKEKRVVTYLELEVHAGVHRNVEAGCLLGRISTDSYRNFGRMDSALVLNQQEGAPSRGFFVLAEELLGHSIPDHQQFWLDEVKKAWDAA